MFDKLKKIPMPPAKKPVEEEAEWDMEEMEEGEEEVEGEAPKAPPLDLVSVADEELIKEVQKRGLEIPKSEPVDEEEAVAEEGEEELEELEL